MIIVIYIAVAAGLMLREHEKNGKTFNALSVVRALAWPVMLVLWLAERFSGNNEGDDKWQQQ